MRLARHNLRKAWSDAARAAAIKARRGEAPSAPASGSETAGQAADKANAYIAAHPEKFAPIGTKKPKVAAKGKGKGAGKAKDPKAEAAKAAEHAQRQQEHTQDRAQRQADRETHAKEHAQAQAEHAQSRAEHEQDRTQRQADRQARLKQQADKAKEKAKAGSGKKSGGGSKSSGSGSRSDAAAQARAEKQQAQAEQGTAASALSAGGQLTQRQADTLLASGLAKPRKYGGIELTPKGRLAAQGTTKQPPVAPRGPQAAVHQIDNRLAATPAKARKMAKRARDRAWEAETLMKAELPDLASNAHTSLRKYL